jgi:hypothetical protein
MAEYGGKDPVFDLARAESTFPDGSRSSVLLNSRSIPTLVPGFTYDSGHLNETGRQAAAVELLRTLALLMGP